MTNPLLTGTRPDTAQGSLSRPVTRTSRAYVYDLADAYNAAMSPAAQARGLEWHVSPTGELRLGYVDGFAEELNKQIADRDARERERSAKRQGLPVPAKEVREPEGADISDILT